MARSPRASRVSPSRFLRDLIAVLVVASLVIWATTRWVAIPFAISGPSMTPTLEPGERVLVDLWTFRHRAPRPGEIVVIVGPGDERLVKRIGRAPFPGHDPYPAAQLQADSPLEPSFIVLGDNLANSQDSRAFGAVPLHRISGRVVFRYWPPARAGSIE